MASGGISRRTFLKGLAISSAGLTLTGLAGCAMPAPGATGETSSAPAAATTTLRWHHRLGGYAAYPIQIAAFQEANPGVEVVEETFPAGSAEYGPKIVTLIASGTVGDLTWTALGSGSYQFLVQNNGLAALDDIVAADNSGFTLDEYYPNIVASLRNDGKLYGLPELAHGVNTCLYFNRDAIEEAGLEAPTNDTTRDQLTELALAMTKEDQYGFLPATGDYSNTRNQTLPYGGELMSNDGTTSLLEDDAVKEGLRWVYDQFYTHKVAPTPQDMQGTGRSTDQMFLAKQLIAFQSGGWSLNTLVSVVADQFAWDMVLMSKGPAGVRGGHLHVDAEAVTEQSKQKELAYELAKFLTNKEGGVGIASENGLAARPDVYADERIANNPHLVLLGQSVAEAAEHINPANLRKQELQTTINAIFTPLWLGDEEFSDDFFARASESFQEFLDKPAE